MMYKDDFMITFDEDGPFEAENNFGVKYQLKDEYALKPQERNSWLSGFYHFLFCKEN